MRRNRKNRKIIIIAILVTMVVGLSLGFAVFSNNLIIKSSATVNTDPSTFQVKFSTATTGATTGKVTATTSGGATASQATLNATEISGLNAKFTKPNQSVTYSFYAMNTGQFDAYLNTITYANASGGSTPIKCTIVSGTNDTMAQAACKGIQVTVTVGSSTSAISTTQTKSSIASHKLGKNANEPISVKIEYKSGSSLADGDFNVAIGNITLNYSSQD